MRPFPIPNRRRESAEVRTTPTILTLIIMAGMWTSVVWAIRQRRARMAATPSPQEVRSYRLHNLGGISAAVGATCFFVWVMTDAGGPDWLHTSAAPAALIFIAVGAVFVGYASWLAGP